MPDLDSVIEYPLDFPVKVMGLNRPEFRPAMIALFLRHAPDFDESTIETRSSREAKYLSLTMSINAVSREQLDALYRDLTDHPMVTMAL
jgi:putative lipoic acid-binding regulatory protein